jgi:AraC-like DNA-binding protein
MLSPIFFILVYPMKFQFYQPSKILEPFLQGFLEADFRSSLAGGDHLLFPNGLSGIFFNFGPKGKMFLRKEFETPAVSIFGQIDRHFKVSNPSGFYSLGVLVHPTLLSKFLKVDMSEFCNAAFDGSLFRQDLTSLHEQMEEALSIKSKIELLESYFLTALTELPSNRTVSDIALQMIHKSDTPSIEKVAHQLNISQRYLEMNFKRAVGVSPKTYSMILRFMRVEQQLKTMSLLSWQKMNFVNEYHDQNHFIKDFKRFTGNTPSRYLIENLEMGKSYLMTR